MKRGWRVMFLNDLLINIGTATNIEFGSKNELKRMQLIIKRGILFIRFLTNRMERALTAEEGGGRREGGSSCFLTTGEEE